MSDRDFDDDEDLPQEHDDSNESALQQLEDDEDSMGEPEMEDEPERRRTAPQPAPAAAPAASAVRRSASTKGIGAAPSSSRAASAAAATPAAVAPVAAAAAATPKAASSGIKPPSSSGGARAGSVKKSSSSHATPRSTAATAAPASSADTARGASPPPVQVHATVPDAKRRPSLSTSAKPPSAPAAAALTRPKPGAPVVAKAKKPAAAAPAPAPVPAAASPVRASDDDEPPAPVRRRSVAPAAKKAAAPPADDLSPSSSSLAAAGYDFDAHAAISSLQDANRSLTAQLAARDSENSQLAEALLTLQEELQSSEQSSGSGLAKELARKNREAGVLLARERARFEKTIDALKKEHAQALEEAFAGSGGGASGPASRGPASPKRGAGSFAFGSTINSGAGSGSSGGLPVVSADDSALEARLRDSLAAQQHLQKQYSQKSGELTASQKLCARLARALVQEVGAAGASGEGMRPEAVLDENYLGKFKGRAQKISLLQAKVRELEKQLAVSSRGNSAGELGDASSGGSSDRSAHSQATATVQDHNEQALARMASEKRAEVASLRETLEARTGEVEQLRRKLEANLARKTTLEKEVKSMRDSARTLFEKSAQDDSLIDEMRRAVDKAQKDLAAAQAQLQSQSQGNGAAEGGAAGARRPASGSGAAAAAAVRSSYDSTKLAEQEKLIVSLREQLRKAQSAAAAASPALAGSLRAYAAAEADTQLALLRVEHDKLREQLGNHAARIAELESQLLQAQKQNVELRAAAAVSAAPQPGGKQRAGTTALNSGAARSTASSRGTGASASASSAAASAGPAPAPSVSTLQSQLQCALSEADLIRTSYANTLANKEQDIAILNDILNQKNQLYQHNIADMRQKFAQLTAALQQ